ncbi:hypothetical protein NSA47_09955 [Irregularibacter muris]|uniref:Uncharacterized protein n=1 Tax=Irregularibacter muris TaxID=1796619 RepID=A0AAE3HEZ0_9FIRM|nr:hypothetical protein [Irregularibacter muris]MCR1899305.1 hypothetical protein [Irregularibacter muris]
MHRLEQAIERIKILECPTGHVEERIAGILEDYQVAQRDEITVQRDESLDSIDAQGYHVQLSNNQEQSLRILAKAGLDDYVAKVTDAYIN